MNNKLMIKGKCKLFLETRSGEEDCLDFESELREDEEMNKYQFSNNKISKADAIKQLRRVLEASGHTKERARVLAKEHYKRFVSQIRG
ncbi:TPA: hypothetical protein NPY75_003202 [Escherichia coli]|nr:hypothetical protein [Escherichia coli]